MGHWTYRKKNYCRYLWWSSTSWWWSFFWKDPTKRKDRSAAYVSRYLAKNIVAAGVSEKCLIQLAYAIGVSKPLSIFIKLALGDENKIDKVKIIEDNFNLSPRGIREMLKLNNPIYETTSAYGHFEESIQIKVNLHGKRLIKAIYLNCNLEKTIKFF